MEVLREVKIGVRLAVGFTLLLLVTGAMALAAFYFNRSSSNLIRILYQERALPVQMLSSMNELTQRNQVLVMEMLISPDQSTVGRNTREFQSNTESMEQAWKSFSAQPSFDSAEAAQVRELGQLRDNYFAEGLVPANEAMAKGLYDDASDIYLQKIRRMEPAVREALAKLMRRKIEQAQQEFVYAMDFRQIVDAVILGATVLALALGGALSWAITRSITGPIREAVRAADQVASGDLTADIRVSGRDEPAEMLASLASMHDSLARIVLQVRQGGVAIGQGAREVATGSVELSQRTEEQAASLEQTSASMSELMNMVNHNARDAQQANQLASEASTVAVRGGEVVQRVAATMEQISDSSAQIADITSVIDGIAFQTNILALNAAVEAARAGEQGRGFAVVASEVRALAQRSASAAREIKALIEQSVQRVAQGATLAIQAGENVSDIVAQVDKVCKLVEGIARASSEQANGIAQVGRAVSVLDGMTQHNAALVEESAAAAESLSQQAAQLDRLVSVFKISYQPDQNGPHSNLLLPA